MTPPQAQASPDPLADLAPASLAETYARLRETAPVHWSPRFGGWVLTRHADVMAVLSDPGFVSDDALARLDELRRRGGVALNDFRVLVDNTALLTDPPRHVAIRKFMSRLFQGPELAALLDQVEDHARGILTRAAEAGGLDLAADFGRELAIFAIAAFLGLPVKPCQRLAAISGDIAWIFDVVPRSLRQLRAADKGAGEILDYFESEIVAARERGDADRFARIVSRADRELDIGDRDLGGLLFFLFIAGQETTSAGIPVASAIVLETRDLHARLATNPSLCAAAARELLRLAAPLQYVMRLASRDVSIGGQTIRAGERVTVVLAAANRDPAAFADPHAADPSRAGSESLTFGHGAHRCLGVNMAQMETEIALRALAAHPTLRLAPETVRWDTRNRVPAMIQAWANFR